MFFYNINHLMLMCIRIFRGKIHRCRKDDVYNYTNRKGRICNESQFLVFIKKKIHPEMNIRLYNA